MTIDEAITKYKKITNTDANCPAYCNISCDKCVDESKQLAEWLEELKTYREKKCNKLVYLARKSIDKIDAVNKGYICGYNNAIDDFVNDLKDYFVIPHDVRVIEMKSEQLKEGAGNGTDNQ